MLLAMAWRNILRNLRRSLLTVIGIASGLAALLFLWGFNDGSHNRMMLNIQETMLGSLQVHKDGFFKHPRLSDHIADSVEVTHVFDAAGIARWSTRLQSFALAAGDDTSAGVMMMGLDPEREPLVTRLAGKVGQGRFLQAGDGNVCLLGESAARNLGVTIGDEVVLLSQDRFDSLAAERFRLIGILDSGEIGIDRGLVIVPLAAAQEMLSMQGRVTGVVALIDKNSLDGRTLQLKAGLEGRGLEVLRWFDMFPIMKEWVRLDNAFFYIFIGIVLMIVVAGVLNTVLASMLERTREFGILMGLGVKGFQIGIMVMLESAMLGIAGVASGTIVGLGLVWAYGRVGIDFSDMMESIERFYVDPIIYTEIDTDHLLITVSVLLLGTIIAAVYPAWRATRLEPVEAIHHV